MIMSELTEGQITHAPDAATGAVTASRSCLAVWRTGAASPRARSLPHSLLRRHRARCYRHLLARINESW